MKNTTASALTAILFVLVMASGCNKNDSTTNPTTTALNGTASFTLNGDGFSNQSFSISGFVGGYSPSDQKTGLAGSNATAGDSTTLSIVFPGSATGTFPSTSATGVVITRGSGSSTRSFVSAPGTAQMVVTAYGSVGGSIVGTFSGKLYEIKNTGMDSVTVSSGSFNGMRVN